MRGNSRPAEILLVDDNPGDVELVHEAFRSAKGRNRITVLADGEAAISFLKRERLYADAPLPDLVLLDLNIPKKDGFEVLKEIRNHPRLAGVPVVVLTGSQAGPDIQKCYRLHANCFLSKPIDVDEFLAVVRSAAGYWLSVAKLPSGESPGPEKGTL